jgi:fumarate hydratase class II
MTKNTKKNIYKNTIKKILENKNKTTKKKHKKFRYEYDSFGKIKVPKDRYWGATTARSLIHFSIGKEHMPLSFIHTYALFKKCAALTNHKLGILNSRLKNTIVKVCDLIIDNKFNDEFPLYIWQTGSGTQTNMNLNEVIANIGNKLLHSKLGSKYPINPNDDVNMSQSSNDSFISVMHITIAILINYSLIPNLEYMIDGLKKKKEEFKNIIKIGRTHFEDAVPITFGQEFSGYVALLENDLKNIKFALKSIYKLAAGGTAVGTGLDAPKNFGSTIAKIISKETDLPFVSADNKYAEISSHNAVLQMSDALKLLATNMYKIASDIRIMGSGPRTGIHELLLPQNEPGSSIMPGKVNPTQCESVTMISIQVMSNNNAVTFANSQGILELNVYNPIMLYNINQSIYLLSDSCHNFTKYCIKDLKVNKKKVDEYVNNALTLVTALNTHIGYEKSSILADYAEKHNISLREANEKLNIISDKKLMEYINPKKMV